MKRTDDPKKARAIGARIAEARNAAGMTQRELGDLLGLSERSIQAYEQGETIPWRFGEKLSENLNRPVSWFWYGDDGVRGKAEILLETLIDEVRSLKCSLETELAELRSEVARLAPKC